ncbi:MAG: hypothetical protein H0W23_05270 [Chloroflexia bacterium]|nr:hypothetical protein [Chloroflexia bacterium]
MTASTPASPSPLDASLLRLLTVIRTLDEGFTPGPLTADVARALDVPEAFVDALFVSARTRGLLKPNYLGRGRLRWAVSATGDRFVENGEAQGVEPVSPA